MDKPLKKQIIEILENASKNTDIGDLKNEPIPSSAKYLVKVMEPITESILLLADEIDKLNNIKTPS